VTGSGPPTPTSGSRYGVGRGWVGPIAVDQNAATTFASVPQSTIPAQVQQIVSGRGWSWKQLGSSQSVFGQLMLDGPSPSAVLYFVWTGELASQTTGAHTLAGLNGYADVNPKCHSNEYFVDCAMQGDYWTTYGSQDSEQRVYNANWVHNILGLHGAPGCNCGCTGCQRKVSDAWLVPMVDPQGRLVHYVPRPGGPAPTHRPFGTGDALCPSDHQNPDLVAYVAEARVVVQNPPDTRWQQEDYPPTEGPTDADIRCAGCWWVTTQLGVAGEGRGAVMDPIMRNGQVVHGLGQIFYLPEGPTPIVTSPHQGGGRGGGPAPNPSPPDPHPSGPQPIGPDPGSSRRYAERFCPPGTVWNQYRGECTYPAQLRADYLAVARSIGVGQKSEQGAPYVFTDKSQVTSGTPRGSNSGGGDPARPPPWNPFPDNFNHPDKPPGGGLEGPPMRPPARSTFLAALPAQGLGATTTVVNTTSPATVGLVAALGGTVGMLVGAALGAEVGSGDGAASARRAGAGGLIGMLAGSFAGAAIAAPSTVSQGA
jgi:hypothetical protein